MTGIQRIKAAGALLLAGVLLYGCSAGPGNDRKPAEPATIKVMYYDEQSLYSQYGMLFSALNPDIEIEAVSTQGIRAENGQDYRKLMDDFIEKEKPDVLMLDADQYERMANDGKLLELEALAAKDKFDMEGLIPGVVDYMKQRGGGRLYGLTPYYYSSAVYYNKDLFDTYGIPYPTDKMSWDELFLLAARFPTDGKDDKRVYGLKLGDQTSLFQLALGVGRTQGLSYLNPDTKQVTVGTDSWKSVFNSSLKAMKSGSLYSGNAAMPTSGSTMEEFLLRDPFISGKVAMTLDGPYLAGQIRQAQQTAKDKAVQKWDLVTVPVNPADPDYGADVSFYQIFAINAGSPHADAAWRFVSYIHSDEFARVTSKTQTGNIPIRAKYLKDEEGHRLEAFYALKPAKVNPFKDLDKLPQDFFMQFDALANETLKGAEDGSMSVSEALDSLQAKAQTALTQAVSGAAGG